MQTDESPRPLTPGTRLFGYEMGRVLGIGSFGTVYVATRQTIGGQVAIKEFLPRELATRAADGRIQACPGQEENFAWARERFLTEARTLSQLAHPVPHPNLVQVDLVFEANDTVYVVMEYVEGTPLDRMLDGSRPWPEERLRSLLHALLNGLRHVHDAGLLHRDIKPSNIMIRSDGSPVLIDFGSARRDLGDQRSSTIVVFTPGFAPPEQMSGLSGPWTDIYALGATLYFAITGEKPDTTNPKALEQEYAGRYSAGLLSAVETALKPSHSERPQSVDDWLRIMGPGISPPQVSDMASRPAPGAFAEATSPAAPAAPPREDPGKDRRTAVRRDGEARTLRDSSRRSPADSRRRGAHVLGVLVGLLTLAGLMVAALYFAAPGLLPLPPELEKGVFPSAWETPAAGAPVDDPMYLGPLRLDRGTSAAFGAGVFVLASLGLIIFLLSRRGRRDDKVDPDAEARDAPTIQMSLAGAEAAANGAGGSDLKVPPSEELQADRTQMLVPDSSADRIPVALFVDASPDSQQVGRRSALDQLPFSVGRTSGMHLSLLDPGVSRHHARIELQDLRYFALDLGSANGTFVNGRLLATGDRTRLFIGDSMELGASQLTFVGDLPVMPDLTGLMLGGRFLLTHRLHQSIRSAAYRAEDQKLTAPGFVTLFSPDITGLTDDARGFRRQVERAARLRHPNIARVVDFGEGAVPTNAGARSFQYQCVEPMQGGTLADFLHKEAMPSLERIASWASHLSDALDYAHGQEVTHGGIKPNCILLDAGGNAVLTDFSMGGGGWSSSARRFGAPAFLSPEQWQGENPGPASDQFSLAAIIYLLTTGSRPFQWLEDPDARMRAFQRGPVPAHQEALSVARLGVPAGLSRVLAKALAPAPSERYGGVRSFARALCEVLPQGRSGPTS